MLKFKLFLKYLFCRDHWDFLQIPNDVYALLFFLTLQFFSLGEHAQRP